MHRLIIVARREARSFASTRWLWGGGAASSPDAGKKGWRLKVRSKGLRGGAACNHLWACESQGAAVLLGIHKGTRPSALIAKGVSGLSGFEPPWLCNNNYVTAVSLARFKAHLCSLMGSRDKQQEEGKQHSDCVPLFSWFHSLSVTNQSQYHN